MEQNNHLGPRFYECGCCSKYHVAEYTGRCGDDATSFTMADLDRIYGDAGWVEIEQTPDTPTPGPWETSRDAVPEWHVQITVYAEATGNRVATVFEREANARLIAAAPDLLEALRPIAEDGEISAKIIANARAAIAKATQS